MSEFTLDDEYGLEPVVSESDVEMWKQSVAEATQRAALDMSSTRELTRRVMERLERELEGAWRAGFDFLYVVTHNEIVGWDDPSREAFTVKQSYIPSNRPDRHPPNPMDVMKRYDLRNVSYAEIQDAKGEPR